jgi:hypothetical protein
LSISRESAAAGKRVLNSPLAMRWVIGTGVSVGLLIALSTLSIGFITGSSPYWAVPHDDAAQHLAGLIAFVRDAWHYPLLAIDGFGYPEGANAANLDVIPLAAIVDKLQYPATGHVFLYLGLWVAASRVLQALLAVLVLSELGERHPIPVAAVALLAAGLPCLLEQTAHEALSSQFLILAALLLYFRSIRASRLQPVAVAGMLLLAVAALVHPYLMVMTWLVWAAGLAERWRRGRISAARALGLILAETMCLFVLLLTCGHLAAVEPRLMEYGEEALNLLSPFASPRSVLLPASHLLGDPDHVLAFEGSNYLGLGLIALLAAAGSAESPISPVRRHPYLAAVLLASTAFALSNRIRLGDLVLLHYALPFSLERLLNLFRVSERFFWPLAQVLVVWAVFVVARSYRPRFGALLLVGACLVQWVDLAAVRAHSLDFSSRPREDPLGASRASWVALASMHRAIAVFPSYACGDPRQENEFDIQLQLIAVRAGVPINSAYLARPNKDCAREAAEERGALQHPPPPGVLQVFVAHPGLGPPAAARDPGSCRPFERGMVCTRAWADPANDAWAAELRPHAAPGAAAVP